VSFCFVEALFWVSSWGVRDGQEGGVPPLALRYAFAVVYPDHDSQTDYQSHDTQSSEYRFMVDWDEGDLCVMVRVVGAVTLGVNVSVKHHDELTFKCSFAFFIYVCCARLLISIFAELSRADLTVPAPPLLRPPL
jgi:hypothetical protein